MAGSERKQGKTPAMVAIWASIISRLGNWQGWVNIILLFLVLEIAILSIEQARWITPQPSLTLVLILSLVTGWLLARSQLPGGVAHILALVAGGAVTAWQAYQLPAPETISFAAFLAFLTWVVGYVSTWFVLRKKNAWVAVCLGAVVVLVNLSNLPDSYYFFFGLYFIAAIFLITQTRMVRQHYVSGRGTGFLGRGLLYFTVSLLCLVILAVSFAWVVPEMRFPQLQTMIATRMLWKQDIEKSSFNFFAAVPAKQPLSTSGTRRDLLFDRDWHQEDRIDFVVNSQHPSYWRMHMYDTYTRQGWVNSPISDYMLEKEEPWGDADALSDSDTITYTVTTNMKTDTLLTAGSFVSSDMPVLVHVSAGDVISVTAPRVLSPGEHYTVTSSIFSPSPADLSGVGGGYPPSIAGNYLQLPSRFPRDIRLLSENITRDARTPYQKIVAIDGYLSQIPYEEEIKPPPEGTDGVAHFLFTQKSGFCLYYASAMAVMLRCVDVPSRLVVGYLPGDPGEGAGEYILRDKHYHTWPQAYFQGYGWVDLEATPGGADSEVSVGTPWVSAGTIEEYPQWGEWQEWQTSWMYGWPYDITPGEAAPKPGTLRGPFSFADELGRALIIIFGGAAIIMLLVTPLLVFRSAFYRWLWQVDRANLASRAYARMCSLASMVGLGPRPQQTPLEFAAELAVEFPEQAKALDALVGAYVENRFGRRPGKLGLFEEATVLKARCSVYEGLLQRLGLVRRLFSRR